MAVDSPARPSSPLPCWIPVPSTHLDPPRRLAHKNARTRVRQRPKALTGPSRPRDRRSIPLSLGSTSVARFIFLRIAVLSGGTILAAHRHRLSLTRLAEAAQLQPVIEDSESRLISNGGEDRLQVAPRECGDPATADTDNMMAVPITRHNVPVCSGWMMHPLDDAQLSQKVKRTKHRGPPDRRLHAAQRSEDVLGRERFALFQNELHNRASRPGHPTATFVHRLENRLCRSHDRPHRLQYTCPIDHVLALLVSTSGTPLTALTARHLSRHEQQQTYCRSALPVIVRRTCRYGIPTISPALRTQSGLSSSAF